MAYEEITALDADTTVALGGINRKTGKKNPTQAEGYYLGKKEVASPKSKSGKAFIYILKTQSGNLGVWGKTNMDNKMKDAVPGRMTLIKHSGMQQTPNGEMYVYTVQQDKTNTIEVANTVPELDNNEGVDDNVYASSTEDDSDDDGYEAQEAIQNNVVSALEKKAKLEAVLAKAKLARK